MLTKRRVRDLYSHLRVRERVQLAMRRTENQSPPEPLLISTMPGDQREAHTHLLQFMAGARNDLATFALLCRQSALALWQGYRELLMQQQTAAEHCLVRAYLAVNGIEPISESDHHRRLVELRDPTASEAGYVDKRAMRRRQAGRQQLERLVSLRNFLSASRELDQKSPSPLDDFFAGLSTIPLPELAGSFEICSDDDVSLPARRAVSEALEAFLDPDPAAAKIEEATLDPKLFDDLRRSVQASWQELRCLQIVSERLGDEYFLRQNPVPPPYRPMVKATEEALLGLKHALEEDGAELILHEPSDAVVAQVLATLTPGVRARTGVVIVMDAMGGHSIDQHW